ncbi:hypothetical protein [Stigmatella aurantiaca]|uniref:Conserved uncharacterized protein n=1 Tax=Stigmatella aurantiaca (strain DW4/3-1) TaxID=378806 RepID=Q094J9_STIAD|nr:hypothetical protein [Stigmatella aurantiaca]ADO68612.1 conserved uncharacterized protein [Stigmatella aurantiaca DW4/3-1]EAU67142.1 conserved hypothetical protein [Stigmatella aurantiaca DW4/3-1]
MSHLPPALRPWAAQLAIFPEEVALSLGPHVARLSAAIGALRPRGETRGGEPQGYDGLTRRGPYERLLLTEWLFALEAPDEFIRRAAFGEQAFLQRAFTEPQGARRTLVLLDAGPDQLGTPRIAHLALLIVLARRAAAAGAGFAWGVLQTSPDRGAFSEVTPATIQSWLEARSAQPAQAEHVARWREALTPGPAPDDGWLVGSARLARFPEAAGLSRVEVSEEVAPGTPRLSVTVARAARLPTTVVFELPSQETCVRLLRNPFAAHTAAPVRLAGGGRILSFHFSADGTRLLFFRADGSVAAQPVPHSARATLPRVRRFALPAGHRVVAAGWRRNGGMLVLSRDDRTLWIHGALKAGSARKPQGIPYVGYEGLLPDAPAANQPPGSVLVYTEEDRERVLARDNEGRLFLINPHGPAVLAQGVSALAEVRRQPVFVMAPGSDPSREGVWLGVMEHHQQRHIPLGPGSGEAYFGCSDALGHPEAGLLALRLRPFCWEVLLARERVEISIPVGSQVLGVAITQATRGRPGLLVLESDKRSFRLVSPSGVQDVTRATEDVVQAAASHGMGLFAWLTVKGEMVVWNLYEEAVVFRAAPEVGR